jgi:peptidyl-tRNA hydrolase
VATTASDQSSRCWEPTRSSASRRDRPPGAGRRSVDYVLEPFAPDERRTVSTMIEAACEALRVALTDGVTTAMNRFHVS